MPRQIPGRSDLPLHEWRPYTEMHRERIRAHAKHDGNGGSMERKAWDDPAWLRVLVEEIGEVAHELTYDTKSPDPKAALREELVQVGAMVAAWLDALHA